MNKAMVPVAAGVIAAVVGLGIFAAAPMLRGPQAVVDAEAGKLIEASRRTFWQFSAEEDRLATVLHELRDVGVDLSLSDEQIEAALERFQNEDADFLTDERQWLDDLTADGRPAQQQLERRYLQTRYGADWEEHAVDPLAELRPSAEIIRRGRDERAEMLGENAQCLASALRFVDQAMAVQKGDVSGADLVEANQLKGTILYHQALASQRRAQSLRSQAVQAGLRLNSLASAVHAARPLRSVVEDYGVDERIAMANDTREKFSQRLAKLDQQIAELRATIDDMTERLATAQATADEARAVMDELEDKGLDLSDPDGFAKFSARYRTAAKTYRDAIRESEILQNGTLADPRNADAEHATGGPGPLAEGDVVRGLDYYQRNLARTELERQVIDGQIQAAMEDARTLQELKVDLTGRQSDAVARVDQIRSMATDIREKQLDLRDRAQQFADDALAKFDQALRSLEAAARAADARTQVDRGSMSAEKWDRSPKRLMEGDRWLAANIRFQIADTKIRKALVLYDGYRAGLLEATLFDRVADPLAFAPRDSESIRLHDTQLKEIRDAALVLADDAADTLTTASRSLQDHWTMPAAVAAARYIRVLFGDQAALDNVTANYQAAVDARADNPFARAYAQRLETLENR